MMKFRKGDLVKVINPGYPVRDLKNETGRIIKIYPNSDYPYIVDFKSTSNFPLCASEIRKVSKLEIKVLDELGEE